MLCIAASHDPIGYVAVAGRGLDSNSIARMTGGSESEVASLISELDRNGVFSRDRQGRIYSRRMIADAKRAKLARDNGKKGGNPTLSKDGGNPSQVNRDLKAGVGGEVKPQNPEAYIEISEANASSVVSAEPKPTELRQPDEIKIAFEEWNALAARRRLPAARNLDQARRKAIRARLADGGLGAWREALAAVDRSPHCRGENDRNWRADLDFVCQPKSWRRLLEGFYGGGPAPPVAASPAEWTPDRWRAVLANFRERGLWSDAIGPKPGEPGCRAPADLLAETMSARTAA